MLAFLCIYLCAIGRFLPPKQRRGSSVKSFREADDVEQALVETIRFALLQVDANNSNAVHHPSHAQSTYLLDDVIGEEEALPSWMPACVEPSVTSDDDVSVATLEMRASCPRSSLPIFLHILPERAHQDIAKWLTREPSLHFYIPMIPKLIPGNLRPPSTFSSSKC